MDLVRDRSHGQAFWNTVQRFNNEQWMTHFPSTFNFVLDLIGPVPQRRNANYRNTIDPRRRPAIILWWFATLTALLLQCALIPNRCKKPGLLPIHTEINSGPTRVTKQGQPTRVNPFIHKINPGPTLVGGLV